MRCHQAVVEELLAFVKHRVNNPDKFVIMTNKKGESALHYGAQIKKPQLHFPNEDQNVIRLLMEAGSDVFMQTKEVKYIII